MFENFDVNYFNNPFKVLFDNQGQITQDTVAKFDNGKLTIADFSSEHYGGSLDSIYTDLTNLNLNFLLLTHDPVDHLKHQRMLFYPYWYHWAKQNFVTTELAGSQEIQYLCGCLNGNPRPHRIYNFFLSKQKSWFDQTVFTFHSTEQSNQGQFTMHPDDVTVDQPVIEFWNSVKHSLPLISEFAQESIRVDRECRLPANTNAYVHLVTETKVIPKVFVSEKTWKPVAAGQLFLVFGNPGTVKYLRQQGVDVFDDIIDHSYDLEDDWQTRLHLIHQQLDKLFTQDLKSMYINTRSRRKNNRDQFFAGMFDQTYLNTIQQCINMLN